MMVKHGKETTPAPPVLNSAVMEGIPKETTLDLAPVRTEGPIQLSARRVPQAEGTATGKAGRTRDSAGVPPTWKGAEAGHCLQRQRAGSGSHGDTRMHEASEGTSSW